MTKAELIAQCIIHLVAADGCILTNDQKHYAEHMSALLDLLLDEPAGSAPGSQTTPAKAFNPEEVLADIAIAIKHRTISLSERWKIVFYHERITCVPIGVDIPQEIILHEFTEGMVKKGFSSIYWNHLKKNVVELYKELHK